MDNLNKKQFVYKREVKMPPIKEDTKKGIIGTDAYTKTIHDSFNIECVIRSVILGDGRFLVLLDDLHERNQEVPKMNNQGKPVKNKKGQQVFVTKRETFQTEIYLSEEQGKEFLKLTAINNYD